MPSIMAAGHVSGTVLSDQLASQNGTIVKDGTHTMHTSHDEDSVTDSDMDEVIKKATINRKARNVMHRVNKEWNDKITAAITKDIESEMPPKSGAGGARKR